MEMASLHMDSNLLFFFSKECWRLRNYSSWITIAIAVHSDPMGNLEFTRKALTGKGMTTKLATLRDIINPDSDYRRFRAAINKNTPSRGNNIGIPWLDLHLTDLQSILDNHPATVRVDDTDLINFERYNKFMDRIKEVAHYTPPSLQEYRDTGQLEYLLDSLAEFPFSDDTENALLARSVDLKAQEKIDVDLRIDVFENLGFGIPNPSGNP